MDIAHVMGQLRNEVLLKLIALRLKNLRQEQNISQEMFYNDTGIHIARIETGKFNITISTLFAICQYFNITLTQFFLDVPEINN